MSNGDTRRILLVEDEKVIRDAVAAYLEKESYWVTAVGDGQEALEEFSRHHFDLVILDLMLPRVPGERVCRVIRDNSDVPIIMLTAKGDDMDKILGLEQGADDYLPKPFAASEFLARVRALTRRSSSYASSMLSFGNVTLDCSQYLVKTALGEARLNNKEYQLMELFFRHPRQVFSSEHLMEKVWGLDSEAEMDVVWTYIGFLRRKLKQIGAEIEIRTIRGAGYALEEMRC